MILLSHFFLCHLALYLVEARSSTIDSARRVSLDLWHGAGAARAQRREEIRDGGKQAVSSRANSGINLSRLTARESTYSLGESFEQKL